MIQLQQMVMMMIGKPTYDMKKKLTLNLITIVIGIVTFFYAQEFGFNFDGLTGIGLILLLFLFAFFGIWSKINQ
jgi:hypothetical protein